MRYVIETTDTEGLIGIQLAKLEKEQKLTIIEKGETLVELNANLERVARALEVLKKAGYNSHVMKQYIRQETGCTIKDVNAILDTQESFFRQIGVLKR